MRLCEKYFLEMVFPNLRERLAKLLYPVFCSCSYDSRSHNHPDQYFEGSLCNIIYWEKCIIDLLVRGGGGLCHTG